MIWIYITAVLTAILGIVGWIINKDAEWWLKGTLVLLVVALLAVQIVIIRNEQKEKEIATYAGVLQGKRTTILSSTQNVYPKLKLGNSNTYINWQGPQGEPMFRIFQDGKVQSIRHSILKHGHALQYEYLDKYPFGQNRGNKRPYEITPPFLCDLELHSFAHQDKEWHHS